MNITYSVKKVKEIVLRGRSERGSVENHTIMGDREIQKFLPRLFAIFSEKTFNSNAAILSADLKKQLGKKCQRVSI